MANNPADWTVLQSDVVSIGILTTWDGGTTTWDNGQTTWDGSTRVATVWQVLQE